MPAVRLKYVSRGAWTAGVPVRTECGPELENETALPIYDVRVSDLVLDPDTSYRFDEIETLRPRQVVPIAPTNALTKAISRNIVKRMLSGDRPATAWSLQIRWRTEGGRTIEARWEIRVVRLPLEIACAPVNCSHAVPAVAPSTALR
ncbi:MAG: hypothetical protein JWL71_4352 [Acidobacteria bacterium]|nr:hypothetical protein [Acidobacteriota bacterium]